MSSFNLTTYELDTTIKGESVYEKVIRSIDMEVIATNLDSSVKEISAALDKISADLGAYELNEIELALEITGSGAISLIGSVSAECKGGITLKFAKKK